MGSHRWRQQPREEAVLRAVGCRGEGAQVQGELGRTDPSTLLHGGRAPCHLNASVYLTPEVTETAYIHLKKSLKIVFQE